MRRWRYAPRHRTGWRRRRCASGVVRRVPGRPGYPQALGAHAEGHRQDFDAIATLFAGGEDLAGMALAAITVDTLRTAFARYAETHEAASIQRCWSTWNVLCTYLYTAERIGSNPMPMVGRPKLAKTLPKALPADAVAALLTDLDADQMPPRRRTDWMQR